MFVRVYITPLLYLIGTCQHPLSTPTPNTGFEGTNVTQRRARELTTSHPTGGYRRQAPPPHPLPPGVTPPVVAPEGHDPPKDPHDTAHAAANRFKKRKVTQKELTRTMPYRESVTNYCDLYALHCLKAYDTGKVCGRTLYFRYYEFKNYCMLDYVNCMETYEVWQILNMGECFTPTFIPKEDYQHYDYENDTFMEQYYIVDNIYG